jgi:hypothetical protein
MQKGRIVAFLQPNALRNVIEMILSCHRPEQKRGSVMRTIVVIAAIAASALDSSVLSFFAEGRPLEGESWFERAHGDRGGASSTGGNESIRFLRHPNL